MFLTAMRRSNDAVRIEIIQFAINTKDERMIGNIEEDGTISNLAGETARSYISERIHRC